MHVSRVPFCSEDEPTGHIEHGTGPGAALNVPAAHSVHTLAPVYPAKHWHIVLPSVEFEFSGHSMHSADHACNSQMVKGRLP